MPGGPPELAASLQNPDPRGLPDVSVVIVNWNTRDLLLDCLRSLHRVTRGCSFEVVIVDNASSDGSAEAVEREFPRARLIRSRQNVGFAAGCNLGAAEATGSHFLLLNSDTVLREDAISQLLGSLHEDPSISMISCRLIYPDGSPQPSCGDFPTLRGSIAAKFRRRRRANGAPHERFVYPFHTAGDHERRHDVDWVAGAVMLVRRADWETIGGLDAAIFLFAEEWEWCLRFQRRGRRVVHDPCTSIVHIGSGSWTLGQDELAKARRAGVHGFFRTQYGRLPALGFRALCGVQAAARTIIGFLSMLIPSQRERGVQSLRTGLGGLWWALAPGARRPIASHDLDRTTTAESRPKTARGPTP